VFSKFDRNINQNRTTVKEKYLEELEILEMSDDQEIQSSDNEEIGESGGNDGQEDFRSGDQILRSLGIISPIMVYCPTNDALVQVTDRLSPVGLCCMLDSLTGLYLTADE
jgi:hypothetical protein